MSAPVIVHGTLNPDGTLALERTPNLPPGPVVVTIETASPGTPKQHGLAEIIEEIRQDRQARGCRGRSPQEIEAVRQEGEAEYEQRMRAIRGS